MEQLEIFLLLIMIFIAVIGAVYFLIAICFIIAALSRNLIDRLKKSTKSRKAQEQYFVETFEFNRNNIERTIKYLKEDVLQNNKPFSMKHFREGQKSSTICNSSACIIGYATALDSDNIDKYYRAPDTNEIMFSTWSYDFFFDITSTYLSAVPQHIWRFLFSSEWHLNNELGTLEGSIKRLQWFLDADDEARRKVINQVRKGYFDYRQFKLPELQ